MNSIVKEANQLPSNGATYIYPWRDYAGSVRHAAALDGALPSLWNECLEGVSDVKDAVRMHKRPDGTVVFEGRDFGALAALLNQAHRNLELFGKATGLLREDTAGMHVENMMVILPRSAEPATALPAVGPGALDVTAEKA